MIVSKVFLQSTKQEWRQRHAIISCLTKVHNVRIWSKVDPPSLKLACPLALTAFNSAHRLFTFSITKPKKLAKDLYFLALYGPIVAREVSFQSSPIMKYKIKGLFGPRNS